MIARGFQPVAWVAAIGTAALSCYMLSLQVAAERSELASLDRRIVQTRQDIRQLQTELGTRGRLQQLEHWNAEVLALSAPVSGQFLDSGVSLARFDTRQPDVGTQAAQVQMAAAETPATPPVANVDRPVVLASAQAPQTSTPRPAEPVVQRASLATAPAAAVRAAAAPARRSLLDDRTLRDLGTEARAERGGARN